MTIKSPIVIVIFIIGPSKTTIRAFITSAIEVAIIKSTIWAFYFHSLLVLSYSAYCFPDSAGLQIRAQEG